MKHVRRAIAFLSLLFACSVAACIIGPKQDDPAEDRGIEDTSPAAVSDTEAAQDLGFSVDSNTSGPTDTGATTTPGGDAAPDGAADTSAGDAKADGDASDASDVGDASETSDSVTEGG
jgi:hypothetical protein